MRKRHLQLLIATRGKAILKAVGKLTGKQARRMLKRDRAAVRKGNSLTY